MKRQGLDPQQLHAVLEDVQDALFVTDASGDVIYMNPAAIELFGFEERHEDGGGSIDLQAHLADGYQMRTLDGVPVAPDDQPLVRALRGEAYRDVELLVQREGEEHPRAYVFSGRRIGGTSPLGVLTVRDETDRWRAERRYRTVFETDPAPSLVARLADLRILHVNRGIEELTGLDRGDLTDRVLTDLEPLRQRVSLRDAAERLRHGERAHKLERLLLLEHGKSVYVLVSARTIELEGEACGIFTFVDTTELESARHERRAALDRLNSTLSRKPDERSAKNELAATDPLTGIASRRDLSARLFEEASRAERYGDTFCVLLIDLDHFREINDGYGRHVGDLVLLRVARLLREACRQGDVAGRWGGEQFMMILPHVDLEDAERIASRVRELVTGENAVGMDDVAVSIGVASFEKGDTHERLFDKVERALHAAKERGRDRVEVAPAGGA